MTRCGAAAEPLHDVAHRYRRRRGAACEQQLAARARTVAELADVAA
jgi:hypothetical protein